MLENVGECWFWERTKQHIEQVTAEFSALIFSTFFTESKIGLVVIKNSTGSNLSSPE